MAGNNNAPLLLFGLAGVGLVAALAATGGGQAVVQGAQRVGGLVVIVQPLGTADTPRRSPTPAAASA